MNRRCFGLLCLLAGLAQSSALAQQAAQPPQGQAAPDLATMTNELARTIFTAADANRNRWLSRNELPAAIDRLDEAMQQWARQGILGRAKKQRGKETDGPKDSLAAIEQLTARISKNPRVSEPEFTLYVQNVSQHADEHWRQLRAMSEAQRKAYNAYRASLRPQRGRVVTGYPVPSY